MTLCHEAAAYPTKQKYSKEEQRRRLLDSIAGLRRAPYLTTLKRFLDEMPDLETRLFIRPRTSGKYSKGLKIVVRERSSGKILLEHYTCGANGATNMRVAEFVAERWGIQ